jgi:UDP-2,3-diacylglucosamine pyrophosphatase LpxH
MDLEQIPSWIEEQANDPLEKGQVVKKYRTVWISDTHLGSKGCQAEKLSQFLKQIDCERLYLVGDIIDGWRMRKNAYWPQSHSNVVRRILTRSKRDTQVIYITGNHDDFLRRYSGINFGNILLTDEYVHTTATGKKLLIIHGDQFDGVIQCHRWLAFVGDHLYETSLVINRWYNQIRHKLGFGYWSLSAYLKHRVKKAVNFLSEYEEAVAKSASSRGLDGVVCGHIHHAEITPFPNNITYYNCGDWVESCTALVEDFEGNIKIIHWIEEE